MVIVRETGDQDLFREEGLRCQGQEEGPARSLKWLRCWLHTLTWDHCLLLTIIYVDFASHLIILSLGVICLDLNLGMNQGSGQMYSLRPAIGSVLGQYLDQMPHPIV